MTEPARRRATYQDVLATPRHQVAEIVDGELYIFSRPRFRHALAGSELQVQLYLPFHRGKAGPGGWFMLPEPELHLGEHIVVPNITGWRRERFPGLHDDPAYLSVAPDWLCEVLSPSTESFDRAKKLPVYAAAGVGHAWLVHPIHRTLEVLRLHGGAWRTVSTHVGDQRVRAEPFDAVELDLSMAWHWMTTPLGSNRACEPTAPYRYRNDEPLAPHAHDMRDRY